MSYLISSVDVNTDGQCYLQLFPRRLRHSALSILGSWPTLLEIIDVYDDFGLSSNSRMFSTINSIRFGRLHIVSCQYRDLSLDMLIEYYPLSTRVGGNTQTNEAAFDTRTWHRHRCFSPAANSQFARRSCARGSQMIPSNVSRPLEMIPPPQMPLGEPDPIIVRVHSYGPGCVTESILPQSPPRHVCRTEVVFACGSQMDSSNVSRPLETIPPPSMPPRRSDPIITRVHSYGAGCVTENILPESLPRLVCETEIESVALIQPSVETSISSSSEELISDVSCVKNNHVDYKWSDFICRRKESFGILRESISSLLESCSQYNIKFVIISVMSALCNGGLLYVSSYQLVFYRRTLASEFVSLVNKFVLVPIGKTLDFFTYVVGVVRNTLVACRLVLRYVGKAFSILSWPLRKLTCLLWKVLPAGKVKTSISDFSSLVQIAIVTPFKRLWHLFFDCDVATILRTWVSESYSKLMYVLGFLSMAMSLLVVIYCARQAFRVVLCWSQSPYPVGYCYLRLFRSLRRPAARRNLGANPTLRCLYSYSSGLGVHNYRTCCSVLLKDSHLFIGPGDSSWSISDLARQFAGEVTVGYDLGRTQGRVIITTYDYILSSSLAFLGLFSSAALAVVLPNPISLLPLVTAGGFSLRVAYLSLRYLMTFIPRYACSINHLCVFDEQFHSLFYRSTNLSIGDFVIGTTVHSRAKIPPPPVQVVPITLPVSVRVDRYAFYFPHNRVTPVEIFELTGYNDVRTAEDVWVRYTNTLEQLPHVFDLVDHASLAKQTTILTRPYRSRDVHVSNKIVGNALAWIKSLSSVNIVPDLEVNTAHFVAAAVRNIVRELIKRDIPTGSRVLVVGANPAVWPHEGYVFNIPIVDSRDPNRMINRMDYINKCRARNTYIEVEYDLLQDVSGTYDVMVLVDSCYDIPMEHLFKAAVRLGVFTIYNAFMVNASLLSDEVGVLLTHSCRFIKYIDAGVPYICFSPLCESQNEYWHRYEHIYDYSVKRVVRVGDRTFFGDVFHTFPDDIIVKYTRSGMVYPRSLSVAIQNLYAAKYSIVTLWDNGSDFASFGSVDGSLVVVPTYFLNMCYSHTSARTAVTPHQSEGVLRHLAYGAETDKYIPGFEDYSQKCDHISKIIATAAAYSDVTQVLTDTCRGLPIDWGRMFNLFSTLRRVLTPAWWYRDYMRDFLNMTVRQPTAYFTSYDTACSIASDLSTTLSCLYHHGVPYVTLRDANSHDRIGSPSCNYNIELLKPNTCYSHHKSSFGTEYFSIYGTFIESVFDNPLFVHRSYCMSDSVQLDTVIDLLFSQFNIIVICGDIINLNRVLSNESISDQTIIRYHSRGFSRIVPNSECTVEKYCVEKVLNVMRNPSLTDFLRVASMSPVSSPTPLCLYRELLGSMAETFAEGDRHCDAMKSAILMNHTNTVIFDCKNVYVPSFINPRDVKHLLYFDTDHTYRVNVVWLNQVLKMRVLLNIFQWPHKCNGPIDLDSTSYLRDTFNHLVMLRDTATSDRLAAVYETLAYSARLQYNLACTFAMIASNPSRSYLRAVGDCYIYDPSVGRFINDKPTKLYNYGWCDGRFIDLTFYKGRIYPVPSSLVFVSDDTQYLRDRNILENFLNDLNSLSSFDWSSLEIVLNQGVPGCGKTYSIIRSHRPGIDLVCTTTKAANSDYRQLHMAADIYYRTFDSVLLNPAPYSDLVYADEGLMIHPGDIYLIARKVCASKVIVFGDRLQIPFINRVLGIELTCSTLAVDNVVSNNVTYRLPRIMVDLMRPFYPELKTKSILRGQVEIRQIRLPSEVVTSADVILCFTQFEKQTLTTEVCGAVVMTVHEAQGKTFDSVALVRFVIQDNDIYKSEPHIIVGISRHRNHITYFTCDCRDAVSSVLLGNYVPLMNREINVNLTALTNCPVSLHGYDLIGMIRFKPYSTFNYVLDKIKQLFGLLVSTCPVIPRKFYTLPEYPKRPFNHISPSVVTVQLLLDKLFLRLDVTKYIGFINTQIFPLEPEFSVNFCRLACNTIKESIRCEPILNTPQPFRCKNSLVELVYGIRKRNLNPPKLYLTRYPELVDQIVDRFFTIFVDDLLFQQLVADINYSNSTVIDHWYATRTPTQRSRLDTADTNKFIGHIYDCNIKADLKPKLDNTHNIELIAGQVIASHDPQITAAYSPHFKLFSEYLKAVLYRKWVINDGLNKDSRDAAVNYILKGVKKYIPQEVDISKFDKSQEELCLRVQMAILRKFRFPNDIIDKWFNYHTTNRLVCRSLGLSVRTKFQRRSGDASTFIGNTIVTMFSLAFCSDYDNCYGGIFGGDDSLIFMHPDANIVDVSKPMSEIFNLSVKLESYRNSLYFSSQFLIHNGFVWTFMPDPIKALVRLGRRDIYCKSHASCYWRSFSDNMSGYTTYDNILALHAAVRDRYCRKFISDQRDLYIIFSFIRDLVKSESLFLSLYTAPSNIWHRPLPPAIAEQFEREFELTDEFDLLLGT